MSNDFTSHTQLFTDEYAQKRYPAGFFFDYLYISESKQGQPLEYDDEGMNLYLIVLCIDIHNIVYSV